jgi:hypothetical protein
MGREDPIDFDIYLPFMLYLCIITQFNTEKEHKLRNLSLFFSSTFHYFVASLNNPFILPFSKVVNLHSALKTTEYTNKLEK